jgi:CheY-like chemotaxis protein
MARILIVDDDPDFALVCRSVLEAEGYAVSTAANGSQAMDKLHQERPDLMLLDVMMSTTLEGVDFCRKIRSEPAFASLPIVMVSSIGTTEYAAEFPDDERVPIDTWLSKPLQPAILAKTVKRLLANA